MGLIVLGSLVYSFICVCLAAYVSAGKNRPDWEPYVFGFLLGPIGVLIMAVLPTMPAKEPQQPQQGLTSPSKSPPTVGRAQHPQGRTSKPLGGEVE
jgi:hypothetical protein